MTDPAVGSTSKEPSMNDDVRRAARSRSRLRGAGQMIPLFALSIFVLMGMTAVVIDLSWYWSNTLRVQRAADAAALAGAVWLPGDVTTAYSTALQEATKNGYTTGGGVTVTPIQDSQAPGGTDPRQLNVTVSAQVNTFFMRVFGLPSIMASRTSKAEFVQPVPMGSPLAYYGISCLVPLHPSAAWPTPSCATSGNSNGPSGVTTAAGMSQLASQGFWGVVFQRGGDARNGDAFSPLQMSDGAGGWVSNSNPPNPQGNFDPTGYVYSVEVPVAGGAVYLFDPEFCEVGENGDGQSGVGDQYTTAGPGATSPGTVTTYYNLYNTRGTAFTVTDDTLVTQRVYSDAVQTDQTKNASNEYVWGTPAARAGARDCGSDAGHNRWVLLANGLPAGKYRLQVTSTNVDTSSPSGGTIPLASQPSDATGAANRFGIQVTGGGQPRVYGDGLMGAYNNLPAGRQLFYLAQIDVRNAGKTAIISLYDPGDVGGGAWLRILTPDGNQYNAATMSWTSVSKADGSAGPSGTGTCIQTNSADHTITPPAGCPNASGGGSNFDGRWLTINVSIPQGYGTVVPPTGGSVGLTPAGEPGAGWWKIEYTVSGGNDTTTWQVNIRGNPVHLIVP
jgi:Flp pilus assembly protein TadG